jgi:hypothetical protein
VKSQGVTMMKWPAMRIYLAGPYIAPTHSDRQRNVYKAMDAALEVIALGHYPFVPHLSHYVDYHNRIQPERARLPIDYEDWMQLDLQWLLVCEALVLLAPSPGANRELARARKEGLVIFDSVAAVPRAGEFVREQEEAVRER